MISGMNSLLLSASDSLRWGMQALDASGMHTCFVVDGSGLLIGALTDGDVRRAILAGRSLDDDRVEDAMSRQPKIASADMSDIEIHELMGHLKLEAMPVLDQAGRLIDIVFAHDNRAEQRTKKKDNWVLLMAGGLGTRLRPFTETVPKPMLLVGEKPILEIILERFIAAGFRRFYISVNYKREQVIEHFGDGSRWGVEIRYLEEEQRLGTAGPLGLLPERPDKPLMMMNGDILTEVNLGALLEFYEMGGNGAVMCVRKIELQVPFGVVNVDESVVQRIDEKPVHEFLINAGIYVFSPEVIDLLSAGEVIDVPHLLDRVMQRGMKVGAFPLRERWLDVGQPGDLERARLEWR